MASPLADLDELVLKCRDERTKAYISEAVASYKAGAFRSAIVGTWIAVCFDVIEKFRELALSGDKEAELRVEDLEKTRKSGDITRALQFEREILVLARDKFELLSHIECVDLQRLQEDRNRCAHPSLVSEEQVFLPSAELARLHLYSAITHLLQHPPVQGKYALERLVQEVDSEYFPDNKDKARITLSSGPLRKPRESLVRNFVVILEKRILIENTDWKHKRRVSAALNAVSEMQQRPVGSVLSEKLSPIVRAIPDAELKRVISFLSLTKDTWQFLDGDVRQRIENYVRALPIQMLDELDFLLSFPPLRQQAIYRAKTTTKDELRKTVFFELPSEI